jgi:hypothetical protein
MAGRGIAIACTIAWIALSLPGFFFAAVGFIGLGMGGGGGDVLVGAVLLMAFPFMAIAAVIACWILRAAGHPVAGNVAILLPVLPTVIGLIFVARFLKL